VLPNLLRIPLLCAALAVEFFIAVILVGGSEYLPAVVLGLNKETLLATHIAMSLLAAICISSMLNKLIPGRGITLVFLLFLMSTFVPFVGAAGCWLSITFGAIMAQHRHKENVFWQYTDNTELPFATPVGRSVPQLDNRGFIEQLAFDTDTEKLYNKVVASQHIRDSQSGPVLKSAVKHSNERIRLVAYQMLDKKTSALNKEIQRLSTEAQKSTGLAKSNIHLQIASNYWELLTLEDDEPVAREQLLDNAEDHANQAIEHQRNSINAHFLLGRIYLKQDLPAKAARAFEQAQTHGMSKDKVIPFVAEAAFVERDFEKLRNLLSELDPAFKSYPPFSNVVEYWA